MARTYKDQRKYRRKSWKNGKGVREHQKRERRRKAREKTERKRQAEVDRWQRTDIEQSNRRIYGG